MSYEKEFRKNLGFTNAQKLKTHLKATDIKSVNLKLIKKYNERLSDIIDKLNTALHDDIKFKDTSILKAKLENAYKIMKVNKIFPKLNNQGRSPEDVYYNWMRGYIICELFIPSISILFKVDEKDIKHIGEDDLSNPSTFSRSATADLQLNDSNSIIRIEMQSGFSGNNDIKKSKIIEAINNQKKGITTYLVHIDVFNGKAAIINITKANLKKLKFNKNPKFEGSETLSIDNNWFKWNLSEALPELNKIVYKL